MWPGRPPTASRIRSAAASTRSHGPSSSAGLEVPLHPALVPDELPGAVDRDPPVDADDVAAGFGHLLQEVRRPGAEVDRRHVHRGQHLRGVGRDELAVVVDRERADPRVEELDHVGPGLDAAVEVERERGSELLHQGVPDLRLPVHAGLRQLELTGRLALDQVAGDRERAAGEADHRLLGRERLAHEPHGLEDEGHRFFWRPGTVSRSTSAAERTGDSTTGPTFSTSSTSTPMPRTGKHDVGEHHRCVHAVCAHRLERHLGAELGLAADLEEPVTACGSPGTPAASGPPGA